MGRQSSPRNGAAVIASTLRSLEVMQADGEAAIINELMELAAADKAVAAAEKAAAAADKAAAAADKAAADAKLNAFMEQTAAGKAAADARLGAFMEQTAADKAAAAADKAAAAADKAAAAADKAAVAARLGAFMEQTAADKAAMLAAVEVPVTSFVHIIAAQVLRTARGGEPARQPKSSTWFVDSMAAGRPPGDPGRILAGMICTIVGASADDLDKLVEQRDRSCHPRDDPGAFSGAPGLSSRTLPESSIGLSQAVDYAKRVVVLNPLLAFSPAALLVITSYDRLCSNRNLAAFFGVQAPGPPPTTALATTAP